MTYIRTHRQAIFIFACSFSGFLAIIKFLHAHAHTPGTQSHLITNPLAFQCQFSKVCHSVCNQHIIPLATTLEMEVPRASTMGGVVKAWISITGYITYNYYTVVSSLLSFCAYQTFFLEVLLTCNPLSYRLLVDTVRRPCFV